METTTRPYEIQGLQFYAQDLLEVGSQWLDLPTAIDEFKAFNFSWVQQGLLLQSIFESHHWQRTTRRWRDWCEQVLGRTAWYCRRLINGARVVMILIEAGFDRLPRCLAQCEPLFKYLSSSNIAPDEGQVIEKWQDVLAEHPFDHHLTAASIRATLQTIDPPQRRKLAISAETYEKLQRRALAEGKSCEALLQEWLGEDEEVEDTDGAAPGESSQPQSTSNSPVQRWQDDLEALVVEHDLEVVRSRHLHPSPAGAQLRTENPPTSTTDCPPA